MERKISLSEDETYKIAKEFAASISSGDIVCLKGDLGAGKTHFVRGFVEAMEIHRDEVSSPTFTIINEYDGTIPVYHFDCYRLKHYSEALEIGAEEYFYDDGVCIIEWPERILELLPEGCIFISMEVTGKKERTIIFE